MTEAAIPSPLARLTAGPRPTFEDSAALTKKRYRRESTLKGLGIGAIALALGLLGILLFTIIAQGWPAFREAYVKLDINFAPAVIDPQGTRDPATIGQANFAALINDSLQQLFPNATSRQDRRMVRGFVSSGAATQLRQMVLADPSLIGQTKEVWLVADDEVDQYAKGTADRDLAEADRRLGDQALGFLDKLRADGRLQTRFNRIFFTTGDSREPELAGIYGALWGSAYLMLVTLVLCVPTGIAAALYLEEFAPKNRITDLIEVNVNNLAAVPSIVFGLLASPCSSTPSTCRAPRHSSAA
jgi:phosphate transport system permease protein